MQRTSPLPQDKVKGLPTEVSVGPFAPIDRVAEGCEAPRMDVSRRSTDKLAESSSSVQKRRKENERLTDRLHEIDELCGTLKRRCMTLEEQKSQVEGELARVRHVYGKRPSKDESSECKMLRDRVAWLEKQHEHDLQLLKQQDSEAQALRLEVKSQVEHIESMRLHREHLEREIHHLERTLEHANAQAAPSSGNDSRSVEQSSVDVRSMERYDVRSLESCVPPPSMILAGGRPYQCRKDGSSGDEPRTSEIIRRPWHCSSSSSAIVPISRTAPTSPYGSNLPDWDELQLPYEARTRAALCKTAPRSPATGSNLPDCDVFEYQHRLAEHAGSTSSKTAPPAFGSSLEWQDSNAVSADSRTVPASPANMVNATHPSDLQREDYRQARSDSMHSDSTQRTPCEVRTVEHASPRTLLSSPVGQAHPGSAQNGYESAPDADSDAETKSGMLKRGATWNVAQVDADKCVVDSDPLPMTVQTSISLDWKYCAQAAGSASPLHGTRSPHAPTTLTGSPRQPPKTRVTPGWQPRESEQMGRLECLVRTLRRESLEGRWSPLRTNRMVPGGQLGAGYNIPAIGPGYGAANPGGPQAAGNPAMGAQSAANPVGSAYPAVPNPRSYPSDGASPAIGCGAYPATSPAIGGSAYPSTASPVTGIPSSALWAPPLQTRAVTPFALPRFSLW